MVTKKNKNYQDIILFYIVIKINLCIQNEKQVKSLKINYFNIKSEKLRKKANPIV